MSRSTSSALRNVSLLACVILSAVMAHAQYRASIQGAVTDPQGAVVSDATVTLTNQETGQASTTAANAAGVYNFNGLPPSVYTIKVEKTGFKQKLLENIKVIAEQANAVNIELEVGQATETVTVTDAAPLIDTETGNVSGTVTAQQIQSMPSFGRDVFQLLQLAPGAFGDGAQASGGGTSNLPGTTVGGTGGTDGIFKIENGGQISANGARTGENNYQIDGVGTTSVTWGGTSVVTPNEDSVKEIKIVTDNYDAENGRYRGAQVQVITQNGTNQYHGSLFFKAHRPGLNAFTKYNGYNSDLPGCQNTKSGGYCGNVRDDNRFNDWGGSAGGPILHNKIFAFFAYETLTNKAQQTTSNGWYETSAFRGLAASGTNAAEFFSFPGVGPSGGTQVDKNCASVGLTEGTNCITIPGQGLNLGRPLTAPRGTNDAGYSSSSSPGTGGNGSGGANNLDPTTADVVFLNGLITPSDSNHKQYMGRLDFNVTSKDLLAFSIFYVPNTSKGINGNGNRLMNLFNSGNTNRAVTLLWDHTFSSSLINEARVNAAGWMDKDLAFNPKAPWGLPQVGFNPTGGFSLNGFGIGSFNGFDQWTYAAKDVLTKVHGAHTMKMGGEFTRLLSVDAPFWSDRPGYTFNNIWDFLNDAPVTENAQFDPQTGVPSALRKDLRSTVAGLFFQDNFKLRPNLTVTAGLRWEYFGPVSELKGKLASVVLGSGAGLFTNMRVRTGGNQFNAQKTNFGPQLGFAWSPGGVAGHDFGSRLVIRGGFGIAYNGIAQSNTLDTRFNPPFVSNGQTFSAAAGNLTYINTFPSNVHNPNGYAANTNAIVTFGPGNLPTTCCTDLVALAANVPTTYDLHYTLGAEYDLGHRWVASVGYQGSQTRHLTTHYNLYDPAAVAGTIFNPVVHGVTFYANNGNGRFNALLLEAKHTFSRSFMLDTQYRLSHAMDPGSNAYAGPFYQWDSSTGFATADYDVRHAFKLFGVWSPTIFHGSRSWMEKVAGGWSLSGILNAHGGFPWTPQYNFQGQDDSAALGNKRFDPVFSFGPGAGGSSSDSGSSAFLPAAYNGGFKPNFRSNGTVSASSSFTPPNVVAGTLFPCLFPNPPAAQCPSGQQGFGPLPTRPGIARNSFRGPGYFDVDATLSKSFGLPNMKLLGEGARLEFRANFYNLFNKLNLNGNGAAYSNGIMSDIQNPNFGESGSALGARVIEMQARFSF
jgi:Carboxypeptidase regulatory-like domain/TonB dependent receptor